MRRSSLRWIIPTFLALQLGLLWIQGAQMHRQNQVLQGLREDIQALTESLDHGQSAGQEDDSSSVPAGFQSGHDAKKQAAVLGLDEEQAPAAKELQDARESAQKAVKEAREAQAKVSIEENIRKADEAKKVQSATAAWQGWVWGAMALVALTLVARSMIRRRS